MDSEGDEEPPRVGVVPTEWVDARCVGTVTITGDYVDLGDHATIGELRHALAASAVQHGLRDLDASAIRLTVPRAFTQDIARHVFDQNIDGRRRWNGVAYRSKYGDDLQNWAIFEPGPLHPTRSTNIDDQDPDLASALEAHALRLIPRTP